MNIKMVIYLLGKMLRMEGLILLIPMAVSLLYREEGFLYFAAVAFVLYIIGMLIGRKVPEKADIYAKEGFVIVAMIWILWSFFGAMPFYFSGSIPKFVDAFFETVSGFTTTGSTILSDIQILPRGMLFWRNLTHWIGGMGVLVLMLAVMPLADKRSMYLMRAEMPGPTIGKLEPTIRSTAKILYGMYFALTFLELLLLLAGGMNLYDACLHAFSTAGTGGFSNRNASVSYYNSAYIDGVITVFMLLFGVNFNVFYFIFVKKYLKSLKNSELRAYLSIIALSTIAITINISGMYPSFGKAFRYAVFQVVSIITTTGFYTANYDLWPEFSKTILILLMIIGSCAGSTGGGIKVSRILIMIKVVKREVKRMLHPRAVSVVKMDGRMVESETIDGVFVYLITYGMILAISLLIVSIDNYDFASNLSGVLTMLNNVGPGISLTGPVENFSAFSWLSKLVFSADMLLGRLEIFPFLMLFSPSLWRRKF